MLLLQADVVAESDAVTSHNHQHVSAAAESHQDESLSNRSCQEGIVNNCQNIAVNAAMCTLCPKKRQNYGSNSVRSNQFSKFFYS